MRRLLFLPVLALGLSGCGLLHSNVKGGFSCGVARGTGTCAPSTTIDDAAIQEIDARKDPPASQSAQQSTAARDQKSQAPGPNHAALRVVYPAWRDGSGHAHKRTVAYVNVDAPGDMPPAETHIANGTGTNLLAIAETAPDLALISTPPSTTDGASQAASTNPMNAIQAQVRDILAKASRPAAPQPAAPKTDSTTFPPNGD